MIDLVPLTADYLRSILDYDPVTGVFIWRERPLAHFRTIRAGKIWNGAFPGTVAGTLTHHGYRQVNIGTKLYKASRLAWLYMTGQWPSEVIDHIDGNRSNDAFCNLRDVRLIENCRNQKTPSHNTSGICGVSWVASRNKWLATIKVRGIAKNLGRFAAKDDAIAARKAAEAVYGFHPNHGRIGQ